VLSSFEESSAANISDMLRLHSNGQFDEELFEAQKFIIHVEALFACIEEMQGEFSIRGIRGRQLCALTVYSLFLMHVRYELRS
jgi:hypothetical protein